MLTLLIGYRVFSDKKNDGKTCISKACGWMP